MITYPGCGHNYEPDDMEAVETEVNLQDGTKRRILFDGVVCCDFWDDSEPGDWVPLASGEEVQLSLWQCSICDSVYEHNLVKLLIDMDNFDPEDAGDPLENVKMAEYIVCSFCQKKEKDRFKTRAEVGL
jgi:hypothetical protein